MTTSDYAEKILELIDRRPPEINPDKLLYEVYAKWKVVEGLRAVQEGQVYPHEQVVDEMWEIIDSKSSGAGRRGATSKKSSPRSRKPRR